MCSLFKARRVPSCRHKLTGIQRGRSCAPAPPLSTLASYPLQQPVYSAALQRMHLLIYARAFSSHIGPDRVHSEQLSKQSTGLLERRGLEARHCTWSDSVWWSLLSDAVCFVSLSGFPVVGHDSQTPCAVPDQGTPRVPIMPTRQWQVRSPNEPENVMRASAFPYQQPLSRDAETVLVPAPRYQSQEPAWLEARQR